MNSHFPVERSCLLNVSCSVRLDAICELAEAELMPFVEHGLLVELVDIADDESWFEAYSLRIPLLRRVDTGQSWAGRSMLTRWWLSCAEPFLR